MRIRIQIRLSAIQLRHHHQQVRPGEHSAARIQNLISGSSSKRIRIHPTQAENNKAVFRIRIGSVSSILGQCGSGSWSKSNSPPSNSATTTSRFVQVNTALPEFKILFSGSSSKRIRIHPTYLHKQKTIKQCFGFALVPDPAFWVTADPDPDPNPGFWWPKNFKKFTAGKLQYLYLGLRTGRQRYRRSLQPSKENIQHFKTWNFFPFCYFFQGNFCSPDPDPGSSRQNQCGSMRIHADPGPKHRNKVKNGQNL
jgi:hypothetical protein